ncbi:ATP-binding protein [candidate division KSB1 bacterium]|nr:ATP-binding protein [candidate division KSB1 bacterium]
MAQVFELQISSDPRLLRVVRATAEQICEIAGFSRLEASKIVLAVDEACSNVIRHAYCGREDQTILITFRIKTHKLQVELTDFGEHVDISKIKPRPLHELRPGGLGVHLITSVMDKVRYSNLEQSGNRMVMEKALPKGSGVES